MATEFRRVPLLAGQFVTVVTKKDGQTRMIVGPDPLEVTDDDIFAIPNKNDPTQLELLLDKEGNTTAIQQFITLGPDEYAVVFNPVTSSGDFSPDYPNGKWQKGKNEVKPLRYGLKQMITRGSFPVWPGQKVEVRKIHHLSATQYLMIQVEEPVIEEGAPYYELVMQCATIKKALVDETIASETDQTPIIAGDLSKANTAEGDGATDVANVADLEKKEKAEPEVKRSVLVVGQRIIIPGNLASTFIPPSGTDVVPVEKEVEEVPVVAEFDPESVIENSIRDGKLKMENLDSTLSFVGLSRGYEAVRDTFVDLRENRQPANALLVALKRVFKVQQLSVLANHLQRSEIIEKKKPVADLVVREALVPGPTQYCVLIDENGDPETKKGPGRVWPGPNDHFRLEGSRDGIYDAYHIRVDRGLLLRVVATEISREELAKQLPLGSKLDKPIYHKGDEIFIGGFDAYFVPSKSVEVRNPLTRQLHIGNDHSEVYVPAIGVDQKSGVYIAKLATGNIALVKGEKSVLPDPRLERHIQRQISGSAFNLMIASQESHKRVDPSSLVTTPWAVSIMVPHNTAVLVTGKDNRRVVVGACRELLEYEEVLEVLSLTKGRPKVSGNSKVETCFLRIDGNRITDRVELETSDFVRVVVDVAYSVKFEGKNQEEMIKWFNFSNYVLFLCDNLRSRLRASAR